jgi:hypothetical protein
MEAVQVINPSIFFELFTTVPEWFFKQSLTKAFGYHRVLTDIGYVQKSPLMGDQQATRKALDEFLPFGHESVNRLADRLSTLNCILVICDISPLGIAAAAQAGIPSVLIENFTWDWIYRGLDPWFDRHSDYLEAVYAQADYHIHTEPVCRRQRVDLSVGPISRAPRQDRSAIRKALAVADATKLILVGMGGVTDQYPFIKSISVPAGCCILFPGAAAKMEKHPQLILLPHASEFFHPDLMHACDAAVGKAGYSTIAEAYAAGIPFGYILRKDSRESAVLQKFVMDQMPSLEIKEDDFRTGKWTACLQSLLDLSAKMHSEPNSAATVARRVLAFAEIET